MFVLFWINSTKKAAAAATGRLKMSVFIAPQVHGHFNPHKPISSRWRENCNVIRCCEKRSESGRTVKKEEKKKKKKNYYELLGVSVHSKPQEIKEAYRKLQKKYHPDIAGQKGHDYTLMLNEAYEVLIKEDLRKDYDASIGQMWVQFGNNSHIFKGHSSWEGPLRPQALFVDENSCIGCRECVHHASKTFVMDEALGCARVDVQYADDDQKIEVAVDSCPVNCIHWVEREELAVLEFLIQPKPKEGYGVFGQGWERPANVFMAAKSFHKQQKRQAECHRNTSQTTVEEETPAQAKARVHASMEIKMGRFVTIWNLIKNILSFKHVH